MVILLGLAAAVLYGSGDFLGGMATRKAPVLAVLTVANTAAVIAALAPADTAGRPRARGHRHPACRSISPGQRRVGRPR